MSVTLDVAGQKWSGFVCPDCRIVFRVPKGHAGNGLVCPGCKYLLRLPGPEDIPETLTTEVSSHTLVDGVRVKRRRSSSRSKEKLETGWEKTGSSPAGGRRNRKVEMFLLAFFVLLLAGAGFTVWKITRKPAATVKLPPTAPVVVPKEEMAAPVQSQDPLATENIEDFLIKAEATAKSFLEAKTIDDLLAVCRPRTGLRGKMESWYEKTGGWKPPGFGSLEKTSARRHGQYTAVTVTTKEGKGQFMMFESSADGLKADWESWVTWSGMPWEEFVESKPEQDVEFRVVLTQTNYYNFEFSDEKKWIAFRLESPDAEKWLYGYVAVEDELVPRLMEIVQKGGACTLTLRFLHDSKTKNQVLITRLVSAGWVVQDDPENK